MFKFIFEIATDPLGLPIEWYQEYLILAVIGLVAYGIAYRCVGDMYRMDFIDGRVVGSFFHWVIRIGIFAALWAVTYGVIVVGKWVLANWILLISVLGGVALFASIVTATVLYIRHRKQKNQSEVTGNA